MKLEPESFIGFYPCRDLAKTTAFYQALGLNLARDQGTCVIFRVAAGGFLGFCQHDAVLPLHLLPHPGFILTLVLNDVTDAYELLEALGVRTEGPPKHNDIFGITHFFARDPDGYRLELQRFDDPLT